MKSNGEHSGFNHFISNQPKGSFYQNAGASIRFISGTHTLQASSSIEGEDGIVFGGATVSVYGDFYARSLVVTEGTVSFDTGVMNSHFFVDM